MGIQGLLPILKPIQRHKHLSEFAGQTLAIDAYVWLHRGAYACAAELVNGRPTRKYVDYCMHRIRLLRHHNISPYLVFDGGPLPAKQSTEREREKRRTENVTRAKELAAQGKESQARDYYVKCVDVTPQMAYQVIKALKSENVPYVVAPYEADAQLAYLERAGFVDGIITEDSDLLVFGCRNVLFKLDIVSSTIINISRSEFGSPSLASDSLSLVGWSDAQFRWMAMLSGCDYLPSIAGIGLKTAYQLLKKYKTVEKVIKMVMLEGKKSVPKGYLDAFYLAEKVFLHQRVYDPGLEKLVYLTNPSDDLILNEEAESYIGRDLDAVLAKRIAEGDTCPISLDDMEDINPSFTPTITKPIPLQNRDTNASRLPKAKVPASRKSDLLNFFTPIANTPLKSPSAKSPSTQKPIACKRNHATARAGNASGKRTLVDVMDQDMMAKRKKVEAEAERSREVVLSSSRFFVGDFTSGAYPSRGTVPAVFDNLAKENVRPAGDPTEDDGDDIFDPVAQEDGYLSPSPCLSRNVTPDLSSPPFAHVASRWKSPLADVYTEFAHDLLSSPVIVRTIPRKGCNPTQDVPTQDVVERILVRGSSEPPQVEGDDPVLGPDLAFNFGSDNDANDHSEQCSDILYWDDENDVPTVAGFAPSPSASVTPPSASQVVVRSNSGLTIYKNDATDTDEILDEKLNARVQQAAIAKVSEGWKARFSFGTQSIAAGGGVRSLFATQKASHFGRSSSSSGQSGKRKQRSRSSLKPQKTGPYSFSRRSFDSGSREKPITLSSDGIVEDIGPTKGGLESFRFSR